MMTSTRLVFLAFLLIASACKQEVAQDIAPQDMTAETLGHYCQMNLLEHPGPKAQVHLKGMAPLFFSQVRDAIAYARAPEQVAPILAIYVNDMGADGATWDDPGATNWIPAEKAHYVVGSKTEGGMGARELVPFADLDRAAAFAAQKGGTVMALSAIPDSEVIAPVALDAGAETEGDADYNQRLKALSEQIGG